MKVVDIKVHCGCGFRADNIHAGFEHSIQTEHQLNVAGTIDIKREEAKGEESEQNQD